LSHTISLAKAGDSGLRDIDEPISKVCCGHRAGMGKFRDTDYAILPEDDIDTSKASGVFRNVPINAIEQPGHNGARRACLGFIQAAVVAIGIIRQVNDDLAS
jgi:hypothetical protein